MKVEIKSAHMLPKSHVHQAPLKCDILDFLSLNYVGGNLNIVSCIPSLQCRTIFITQLTNMHLALGGSFLDALLAVFIENSERFDLSRNLELE